MHMHESDKTFLRYWIIVTKLEDIESGSQKQKK